MYIFWCNLKTLLFKDQCHLLTIKKARSLLSRTRNPTSPFLLVKVFVIIPNNIITPLGDNSSVIVFMLMPVLMILCWIITREVTWLYNKLKCVKQSPTSASVLFFAVSASFVTVAAQHAANLGLTFLIKCNLWKEGFCDRLRANWNSLCLKCSQAITLTWVIASSTENVISLMYQYKWIWMNKGNVCFTQRNKMVPAASAWLFKNREIQKGGKKSLNKNKMPRLYVHMEKGKHQWWSDRDLSWGMMKPDSGFCWRNISLVYSLNIIFH